YPLTSFLAPFSVFALSPPHHPRKLLQARTIRQFDDRITRIVSNYETVDTYYRRCGSAQFLPEVAVPLLAVSALDDPICTREAIPWDEAK
ncbi:unnamed protein product, partial [Closterium sp. NIES-54]